MKNKDIIFIGNAIGKGGAERVITTLANEFSRRGYDVGVLSFTKLESEYPLAPSVERLYGPPAMSRLQKVRRLRWIRRVAHDNPRASIVAFEYFVNIQTLLATIGLPNRIVVSERNDPARVGSVFPMSVARSLAYQLADMLVCQTADAAQYFSSRIPKAVILNPLKPDLPTRFEGVRRKTIVTFCRLEPQKNLPLLIHAFRDFSLNHPEFRLEIYGDGSELELLKALVVSLSLERVVDIHPARPNIHATVLDASMFVLSSDYEGLSNSMLESLAIGLPSICTDCPCGGASTVIDSWRNGVLVPVGDHSAMVSAMEVLATNPELATEISIAASELRDDLTVSKIADQWLSVIEPQVRD